MSTLKKRNGIYYYHHNQLRLSLKTDNLKIAKKLKDDMDLKRLTGQLDQKRMKVLALCKKYLYHVRENDQMAESTKAKVSHQISQFVEYVRVSKCDKYLDEITPDLFHRYANWREIMSIKNDMMSLNKMFSWGKSRGLNGDINVPVGDYVIKKSHKHRAITHEEFGRLKMSRHFELYSWLYYTGLRPSDVIGINRSMIRGRVLTITPNKTANSSGKEVVMVLHKSLMPNPDPYQFYDYLISLKTLDQARREIKKILGKEVTLYSLRYSFNARLKELGADLETRKDAMGHTNIRTTEGYSTQNVSKLSKYIDMME